MKRYTADELQEALRLHRLWARGEEGGVRANLDGANLAGANLDGAYLVRANLDGANLAGAYLVRANLDGAYLVRANLAGAYLAVAYLDGANLDGANLAGANLAGAYLAGANLDGARGFEPFLCIGPIGSRNGYTTAFLYKDQIDCGCFHGTLEAFEAKVRRTHANSPIHLGSYLALVEMVKAVRSAQPVRPETAPEIPPFAEGAAVRLTQSGRERWPWANTEDGEVTWCRNGWTRIEFDNCYLSFPNDAVELVHTEEGAE